VRLRLTLLDRTLTAAPGREVVVEAPEGTTFGAVRAELAALARSTEFSVDAHLVHDSAVLGEEPLLRGATLAVGTSPPAAGSVVAGLVGLRIVGGPGAGSSIRLGRGDHVIGRGSSAAIRLDDPGVSRAHAVVSVRPDSVWFRDLVPTNPSTLDDIPVPVDGATLVAAARLRIGSTTLQLEATRSPGAGHHTVSGGLVHVHRQPRFVESHPKVVVPFPDQPQRPDSSRMPLLASLAPLLLSAGLALALRSPAMLLFALMSPVLLLGQWWSDRRAGRTSYRALVREHGRQVGSARRRVREAVQWEALRRRDDQPDLASVADVVRRRAPELWQRRPHDPDHLVLRMGTGREPARVDCVGMSADPVPELGDVPVTIDLARTGVLGVAGERDPVLSLTGALVAQLVAWHTPRRIRLHVLASSARAARGWDWLSYLPHCTDDSGTTAVAPCIGDQALADVIGGLRSLIDSRDPDPLVGGAVPLDTVVLLDGTSELLHVPGVRDLLRDGPAHGLAFICLDPRPDALPTETSAVVALDAFGIRASIRTDEPRLARVVPDLPTPHWLREFGRLMAPLVDATPESGGAELPATVSFRALHASAQLDVVSPEGIRRSWARAEPRPVALLGQTTEGLLEIDLARDGPHALVAGTTGAGKSELLQSLVAGLAVSCRPDDLTFVLVDYKGGSAFNECARLPHVLGVVTDLDERLTRRALTSLDAELKRRERVLADAGAKDFSDYGRQAAVCRPLQRLARLVIVVDEFKVLAEELPDFLTGLVRIAAVGRSLGVHLVLATQRPGGIVSADLRANVALRVALRVRDRADSSDVIGSDVAARISDRTPGRAFVRAADDVLVAVQTAYVGGSVGDGQRDAGGVRVRVVDAGRPTTTARPTSTATTGTGPTELGAVVSAAAEASRRLGLTVPESPWLPALPDVLVADRLPSLGGADAWAVPLGLSDHPAQQRQEVYAWDPRDGNLGVVGGPRSGRSTALVALALRLAERHRVEDLHLHVLDGSHGPCASLARLPHAGSVVSARDPALVRRVITRLGQRLDDGHSVHTVVVIDGWDSLEHTLSEVDYGVTVDELYRLLRDGGRGGLHFAVSGGRSLLSGRLPGLLTQRLALHLPDPVDLTLAGLDVSAAKARRPPGRAVDVTTGLEVQLAIPGGAPTQEATDAAIHHTAAACRPPTEAGAVPWRVLPLPRAVPLSALESPAIALALGLGGDEGRVVGFHPEQGQRRLLVAGTPRSGVTNTLAVVVARLVQARRPVAVIASRRLPAAWGSTPTCTVFGPGDAGALVDLRRLCPDLCIVVDGDDLVDASPIGTVLEECARLVCDTDGLIVVGSDLSRANASFRGLVPEVARDGCGVILGARSPTDGDVLGVRLDTGGPHRRGRGFLVADGLAVPVQVALAGDPDPVRAECITSSSVNP
jgi:S-DNA-T family DNA segregation ATPase FtsK/SpoIIIE